MFNTIHYAVGAALLATVLTGCTNFGGSRPAASTTAQTASTEESTIAAVDYEEPVVQRGQSPDPAADSSSDAWWDPLAVGRKTRELTGTAQQNRATAKRIYDEAESLYEKGMAAEGAERDRQLMRAAGMFKRAAAYQENSELEENALMYSAECYFFLDKYPDATEQYDALIKKYPNTRHLDTVGNRRFKLARYWLERYSKNRDWSMQPNFTNEQLPRFDRFGNAVKLFDLIRLDDPTGDLADDATLAAANAHFREANWDKADQFYTDLRQSFPTSQHQFTAHYLGTVTKMKVYQGPAYDGTPLEQAETLLTRMKRQFPDRVQENLEVIEKLDRDIRAAKAERLWYMAAFYDKRGDKRGAVHYYRMMTKEFPSSNFAQLAQERIVELGDDLPESDEREANWLVDWLDRSDDLPKAAARPLNMTDTTKR